MLGNLTGWHLLIILAVVLLIFGAAKLPALAKSMGQSARILKSEIAAGKADTTADTAVSASAADVPLPTVAVPASTAIPAPQSNTPTGAIDGP
ncbi:twin-arginine translocase TatA/TatE family subunit [Microbacterium deminutum]|uniref:Sec-independent protein translocase protein TatA n=1 Tax=Microbacterium deminutum TaxID=344164 RepID=A0ABP5CJK9_9MICO